MAQVQARAPGTRPGQELVGPPSVLIVIVAKNGASWVPRCLSGLASQEHTRVAVIAVDNGSTDGSADLLEQALGSARVIRLEHNAGFAAAVDRALASDLAQRAEADFVLLLHDDTVLAPGALAAMLEAATRIEGAGIVGPKVLDWDHTDVLREIGLSTDLFGYPYTPLEDGEIDQGQYERVREVRFVSSSAMLISRQVLSRVGVLDERFSANFEDLDFCWRAQLAGFRTLMTPRAVALHRGATLRKERAGTARRSRARFDRERAVLACMLKSYSVLSLLWTLPAHLALGAARVVVFALTRRFQDALDVLAAWGWNLFHLPGTLRRRMRAQAVRSVPDRSIRRSMAPTSYRLRRWSRRAMRVLMPKKEDNASEAPVRLRVLRYAAAHPVLTAWAAASLVALVAYRHLVGASPLAGGGLAAYPGGPSGFFRELVSGLRGTGLGGSHAASPALGMLGVGSVLTLGSPLLLQKVLLLFLPAGAAIGCYRAVRSMTGERVPSVVAGACYGLSAAALWALSEGRIPVLVLLAGLPWLAMKLPLAFEPGTPVRTGRWIVGAALGLAVLGSFYPGALLAAAVLTACAAITGRRRARRVRGFLMIGLAAAGAAVLAFPLTLELLRSGASALSDQAGRPSFFALLRLSLGPAPGAWALAFYLPVGAALSLVFVSGRLARPAVRSALAALSASYLAWLSAAGYLPHALSNPTVYVSVAAFSFSCLIGLGLASAVRGVASNAFGHRQLGAGLLTLVVAVGLLAQAGEAAKGSWGVGGPERIPAAYPVVGGSAQAYRILWLGRANGEPFPAPGGLPEGTVAAGTISVRWAVTGPGGASALDTGRPDAGPGYAELDRALAQILTQPVRHGGALLAPFGIRFVIGRTGDLPAGALRRLRRQVDLDLLFAQQLTAFHNEAAAPVASSVSTPEWAAAARGPHGTVLLQKPNALPLSGHSGLRYEGETGMGGVVLLAQQFDPRWRLSAGGLSRAAPFRAFGWSTAFAAPPRAGVVEVSFGGQTTRRVQILLLMLLWGAALWIIRRPVRG